MPSAIERRLFAGAFQPDLENALASAVEAHRQERGPLAPAILLVGSNLLGIYLTRLLARRLGAVGGLRVVTFLDLSRALTRAEIDREGLRAIPEAGERLLASTLAAALPHTSYFANIARTQGFEEAILATLRDLRDAGFTPRDLRGCFPRGHRKIQDLAALLENYDETLQSARLIDRSGLLARARSMVEQDAAGTSIRQAGRPFTETSRLFVYGFYDFTWLQESLLLHFARFLPTAIFFPYRETPAFEFARSTLARLRDAGFAPPPGPPPAGTKSFRAARGVGRSLTRLQESLFLPPGRDTGEPSEGGETAGVDASLRMVAAPGEAREVLEAVRAIAGLARQGVPLEEIGVLYRSGDQYARLVASQLADLGIRSFSLEGRALAQTRTARALFALLNIRERDHDRAAVIGFLAIADLDPGIVRDVSGPAVDRAPISPPNPADWDLLSRMARIVSGREEWGERLDRLARALVSREAEASAELDPEAGPPPDPRFIEECRRLRRLHARLAKALDRLPDEASWSTMSETVDGLARRFLAPHEERESILEVVGDLAALEAISPRTTLADFVRILSRELESRGPAEGHFQRGHLFVGDVQTARGLGFRALIVLGLTEHSFPPPIRQDPVLLDAERQALNRSAGDGRRLPLKAERLKEERILFALAAGAAREALVLTYPRLDPQTARERLPSSYLLRTMEALMDRPCDFDLLEAHVERIRVSDVFPDDRRLAVRDREFDLSVVAEGVRTEDAARALFPALEEDRPPFFRRGVAFEQLRWGDRRLTAVDGSLRDPAVRATLARRGGLSGLAVSPTRLEQYMTCPYQYFGERILGLAPLEAPEQIERLSPQDRGTLMHRVLHEFFAGLRDTGQLPLRRAARRTLQVRLREIVDRRFAETEARGLTGLPLLRDIERRKIEEDLGRFLDREIDAAEAEGKDGFRPAHFEVRFGMPPRPIPPTRDLRDDPLSTDQPATLPYDERALLFKGQIDRIDLTPDGARTRVIDYKSGRMKDFPDNSHRDGTALQAPVYMLAAGQLLPGARAELALYQSVSRRGGFQSKRLDRRAWEAMLDDLRAVGRLVEEGIAAGAFFLYPELEQCRWCKMLPLCGEAREARFGRKRSDPSTAAFLNFKKRSQDT